MPTYLVTAPDGRQVKITGDSEPTDQELESIFADLPPAKGKSLEERMRGANVLPVAGEEEVLGMLANFPKEALRETGGWAPAIGGTVGAMAGMGGASVPGAALGAAAGESGRRLIDEVVLADSPPTGGTEAAWDIGKEAAITAALTKAGILGGQAIGGAVNFGANAAAKLIRGGAETAEAVAKSPYRKAAQEGAKVFARELPVVGGIIKGVEKGQKALRAAEKALPTEKAVEKVVPIASGRASRVFQTLAQRAARRAGATQAAGVASEVAGVGKIAPKAVNAIPEAFQESTAAVASKIPAPVMHGKGAQASKEVLEAAGDKLFDQIQNWKTVQKFSDGQVAKILKEMYGVGGSDAKVMIKEVMKNASN